MIEVAVIIAGVMLAFGFGYVCGTFEERGRLTSQYEAVRDAEAKAKTRRRQRVRPPLMNAGAPIVIKKVRVRRPQIKK